VVQPDCAAFPEMIAATGAGRLFEPSNPQAMAEQWEALLLEPGVAFALGRRGREAVERDYSIEAMARQFVALTEMAMVHSR